MSKISIKEIKDRYLIAKEKEKKFKWTYYVRRPASYYLAWPFLKLGISANTITILWLSIAIFGCAFLATGGYVNMVVGTILLEFAIILDCVDGHIARFTGPKYSGDVLDTWAGVILLVLSILSIGIGLSKNDSEIFTSSIVKFLDVGKGVFLYLGIFAAFASLSSWTVRIHWRTITTRLSLTPIEPDHDLRRSKPILIIDNLFHYSGALTVLMVVSSILHVMDLMLIMMAFIYGTFLVMIMYSIITKAYSMDSNPRKKMEL